MMDVKALLAFYLRGDSAEALALALVLAALALGSPPAQAAPLAPKAASGKAHPAEIGPENAQIARRAGNWDVVETVWASPGAAPVSTHEVAERKMIGAFLQEIIRPAPGSAGISRIDYLSFHRLEGRWKYVSMDIRAPVGIMSAASFGRGQTSRIDVTFEPFAIPASVEGAKIAGQLLQMRQLIVQQDANHDQKDQYFIPADGTGKPWLGHRYSYTRRR